MISFIRQSNKDYFNMYGVTILVSILFFMDRFGANDETKISLNYDINLKIYFIVETHSISSRG